MARANSPSRWMLASFVPLSSKTLAVRLGVTMHQEDALLYILQWVRSGSPSPYSNYGYDIYIPNVIRAYLTSRKFSHQEVEQQVSNLSPVFLDAAWELCRR